jgi:hypothetical protein
MVSDASNYQSVADIRSKFKNIVDVLDEKNDKVYLLPKEELEIDEGVRPIFVPLSEYLRNISCSKDEQGNEGLVSKKGSVRNLSEEPSSINLLSRRSSLLLLNGTNVAATNLDNKIKAYAAKVMEEFGTEKEGINFANFRKFIKCHRAILDQFTVIFQELLWKESHDQNNRPVLGYSKM